jgi:diguanylate cyclase (GGDEF)-like protein
LEQGGAPACAILIIDIDYFKSINDLHGHPVGDVTLQHFTTKVRNAIAEPAFFGRLGGEEFVVVLPATDLHNAHLFAERIRMLAPSIDLSRWLGGRRITVSIGVTASTAADTVSTMLRRADAALYTAKHAGRNCVRTDLAADVEVPTAWCETGTATL